MSDPPAACRECTAPLRYAVDNPPPARCVLFSYRPPIIGTFREIAPIPLVLSSCLCECVWDVAGLYSVWGRSAMRVYSPVFPCSDPAACSPLRSMEESDSLEGSEEPRRRDTGSQNLLFSRTSGSFPLDAFASAGPALSTFHTMQDESLDSKIHQTAVQSPRARVSTSSSAAATSAGAGVAFDEAFAHLRTPAPSSGAAISSQSDAFGRNARSSPAAESLNWSLTSPYQQQQERWQRSVRSILQTLRDHIPYGREPSRTDRSAALLMVQSGASEEAIARTLAPLSPPEVERLADMLLSGEPVALEAAAEDQYTAPGSELQRAAGFTVERSEAEREAAERAEAERAAEREAAAERAEATRAAEREAARARERAATQAERQAAHVRREGDALRASLASSRVPSARASAVPSRASSPPPAFGAAAASSAWETLETLRGQVPAATFQAMADGLARQERQEQERPTLAGVASRLHEEETRAQREREGKRRALDAEVAEVQQRYMELPEWARDAASR